MSWSNATRPTGARTGPISIAFASEPYPIRAHERQRSRQARSITRPSARCRLPMWIGCASCPTSSSRRAATGPSCRPSSSSSISTGRSSATSTSARLSPMPSTGRPWLTASGSASPSRRPAPFPAPMPSSTQPMSRSTRSISRRPKRCWTKPGCHGTPKESGCGSTITPCLTVTCSSGPVSSSASR